MCRHHHNLQLNFHSILVYSMTQVLWILNLYLFAIFFIFLIHKVCRPMYRHYCFSFCYRPFNFIFIYIIVLFNIHKYWLCSDVTIEPTVAKCKGVVITSSLCQFQKPLILKTMRQFHFPQLLCFYISSS